MISNKIQNLVQNSSTIRAMFEEGKRLASLYGAENVYDFSIGNPNLNPPDQVRETAVRILEEDSPLLVHGYMSNSGYEDVRDCIASHINKQQGTSFTRDNLIMTCGAAGGLNILLKTLLNPGDEVVVLAPFFGEYASYVDNFNGRLVIVETNPETFQPDLGKLEAALTSNTKALILNTPNNPTGVVYPETILKEMASLLEQKEREFGTSIYVISDEPYREIVYDGVTVPFLLNYFRNGVIGYSYSKSLSLPGERIGYVLVNSELDGFQEVMAGLNVANRILGFVNAPSLFQRVIAQTLDCRVNVDFYRQNRDILYSHLNKLGFSCVKPKGAFYLFPKAPIADDREFVAAAKEHRILLVPGSSFHCPGFFRLSYCVSHETAERSLDAFTKLAEKFPQ